MVKEIFYLVVISIFLSLFFIFNQDKIFRIIERDYRSKNQAIILELKPAPPVTKESVSNKIAEVRTSIRKGVREIDVALRNAENSENVCGYQ